MDQAFTPQTQLLHSQIIHPILVIEDDDDIRELMKAMLEAEGYFPVTATNGQEGIEMLSKIPHPCMILLDLMMPVMDGWTFSEEVKKNADYKNIPLLAVTAFSDQIVDKDRFFGVLKKPIRLDTLLEIIRDHCPTAKIQ